MGIFDIFSTKPARVDMVSRRNFLKGVLAAAPAAVAAAAAVELKFVPEILAAVREEVAKIDQISPADLGLDESGRILVAAPKQIFDPNARVWRSVAQEAGAWADYVVSKTGVHRPTVLRMCEKLARAVDIDLRDAEIDSEQKIDVQLPVVTRQWKDLRGQAQCEIGIGLHKTTLFDGSEQMAVTFKGPLISRLEPFVARRSHGAEVERLPHGFQTRGGLGPQDPLPVFDYDTGQQIS